MGGSERRSADRSAPVKRVGVAGLSSATGSPPLSRMNDSPRYFTRFRISEKFREASVADRTFGGPYSRGVSRTLSIHFVRFAIPIIRLYDYMIWESEVKTSGG